MASAVLDLSVRKEIYDKFALRISDFFWKFRHFLKFQSKLFYTVYTTAVILKNNIFSYIRTYSATNRADQCSACCNSPLELVIEQICSFYSIILRS